MVISVHNGIKETFSKHIVFLKDDAVIDGFTIENAYNIKTSTNKSNRLTPALMQNSNLEGTGGAVVIILKALGFNIIVLSKIIPLRRERVHIIWLLVK